MLKKQTKELEELLGLSVRICEGGIRFHRQDSLIFSKQFANRRKCRNALAS